MPEKLPDITAALAAAVDKGKANLHKKPAKPKKASAGSTTAGAVSKLEPFEFAGANEDAMFDKARARGTVVAGSASEAKQLHEILDEPNLSVESMDEYSTKTPAEIVQLAAERVAEFKQQNPQIETGLTGEFDAQKKITDTENATAELAQEKTAATHSKGEGVLPEVTAKPVEDVENYKADYAQQARLAKQAAAAARVEDSENVTNEMLQAKELAEHAKGEGVLPGRPEQVVLNPEIDSRAQLRETAGQINHLKNEKEIALKEFLQVDYRKKKAWNRVGDYFKGVLSDRSREKQGYERDTEVAEMEARYENKLRKYREAVVADAKARGASDRELANIFLEFNVNNQVRKAEMHDQIKSEAHEGKITQRMEQMVAAYRKLPTAQKILIGAAFVTGTAAAAQLGATAVAVMATAAAGRRAFMGMVAGVGAAKFLEHRTNKNREESVAKSAEEFAKLLEKLSPEEKYKLLDGKLDAIIRDEERSINTIKNKNLRNLTAATAFGTLLGSGMLGSLVGKGYHAAADYFKGSPALETLSAHAPGGKVIEVHRPESLLEIQKGSSIEKTLIDHIKTHHGDTIKDPGAAAHRMWLDYMHDNKAAIVAKVGQAQYDKMLETGMVNVQPGTGLQLEVGADNKLHLKDVKGSMKWLGVEHGEHQQRVHLGGKESSGSVLDSKPVDPQAGISQARQAAAQEIAKSDQRLSGVLQEKINAAQAEKIKVEGLLKATHAEMQDHTMRDESGPFLEDAHKAAEYDKQLKELDRNIHDYKEQADSLQQKQNLAGEAGPIASGAAVVKPGEPVPGATNVPAEKVAEVKVINLRVPEAMQRSFETAINDQKVPELNNRVLGWMATEVKASGLKIDQFGALEHATANQNPKLRPILQQVQNYYAKEIGVRPAELAAHRGESVRNWSKRIMWEYVKQKRELKLAA